MSEPAVPSRIDAQVDRRFYRRIAQVMVGWLDATRRAVEEYAEG